MHSTSDEHEWHTFCSAPSAANISQRPFASTLENLQIICKTPVSPKIRYFCPEPSSTGAALLQFRFFSKVGACVYSRPHGELSICSRRWDTSVFTTLSLRSRTTC